MPLPLRLVLETLDAALLAPIREDDGGLDFIDSGLDLLSMSLLLFDAAHDALRNQADIAPYTFNQNPRMPGVFLQILDLLAGFLLRLPGLFLQILDLPRILVDTLCHPPKLLIQIGFHLLVHAGSPVVLIDDRLLWSVT